jgi:TetR/AcrR family transcriptional regulator, regulator of cefoperazone and chloramphenicol sensitivity
MIVNMRSPQDDRTARARIRDEALRLFGESGPDAVTIRDIAAAAGVSPALVMRHYKTKEGLREAVDGHVAGMFEAMLAQVSDPGNPAPFSQERVPALAEMLAASLPPGSAIPAYIGRMLVSGEAGGPALFARLYAVSREALSHMAAAGTLTPGTDPAVRAAFLLVNDLAVLILRDRIREVLGADPLSAEGARRWGAEVLTVYRGGLGS